MPFAATWMDLEIIILSEVSQRQISYDIIFTWNLKYDANELICKAKIESQTQETHVRESSGEINQEFVMNRYTPVYIKQLNNKVLLYSTENCVQYPITSHNGKEYEKQKFPGGPVVKTLCFYC